MKRNEIVCLVSNLRLVFKSLPEVIKSIQYLPPLMCLKTLSFHCPDLSNALEL